VSLADGEVIGVEHIQVDQLVEAFLAELLTHKTAISLPTLLQEVAQGDVGLFDLGL